MRKHKRLLWLWSLGSILLLQFALTFHSVAAITKGYTTSDTQLVPGMVARLSESDGLQAVERADQLTASGIIGVATTVEDSLVTVASNNAEVYIETEGEVDAYVTNLNGNIKKGDLLIVSPLRGILMSSTDGAGYVVAIALDDFDSGAAQTYPLEGGDSTQVMKMRVNLDQKGIAASKATRDLSALERLGLNVTGKGVSEIRVMAALIIFFVVMVVEGAILYGSISSAINAVGRNPLAGKMIRSELYRVLIVVCAVLVLGVGSIYTILWI